MKSLFPKLTFALLIALILSMNVYQDGIASGLSFLPITMEVGTYLHKIDGANISIDIPQMDITSPSYPIGMESGESKILHYTFIEEGKGSGKITSFSYRFYTQYDEPLSEPIGPFPSALKINLLGILDWDELVHLPTGVVDAAREIDEFGIVLKTTFNGTSLSGKAFNAETSALLLLRPTQFSKSLPKKDAIVSQADLSLQWESSIGATDYEYCFDTINNNSCDTDWTGTYWPGVYDTNITLGDSLPLNTTFYWQVRANNLAGTTYANEGNWWAFATCKGETLTVQNTNDSGAGSLRQTIDEICPGGIINFDSSLAGQSIALSSTLTLNKDLTIDGSDLSPHVRISGNNSVGVFFINEDSNVLLSGLDIVNGNAESGGGIANYSDHLSLLNVILNGNIAYNGGGMYNYASNPTVEGVTFNDNYAVNSGGGMYNSNSSPILMDVIFAGNYGGQGGGVFNVNNVTQI